MYERSKVEGERLVEAARAEGRRAATVRLSNIYGSAHDHADRVIPAFLRAVVSGTPLRVDGAQCTFDFTHIDDTIRGMVAVADRLAKGQELPPVHLVAGRPTALGGLAGLAVALAGGRASIIETPPRSFDVARLHGSSASLPFEAATRGIPVVHTLHDFWIMCPRGQFMQTHPSDPDDFWAARAG